MDINEGQDDNTTPICRVDSIDQQDASINKNKADQVKHIPHLINKNIGECKDNKDDDKDCNHNDGGYICLLFDRNIHEADYLHRC